MIAVFEIIENFLEIGHLNCSEIDWVQLNRLKSHILKNGIKFSRFLKKLKGVHKQTKALPIVCECNFHTLHFLTLIHFLITEKQHSERVISQKA